MEIFLVGGAVRDQLLGIPVEERDWVVVGGTPEALLSQGYKPVGRSFPVFLHPQTKEEYALARLEKKQGSGYYGFSWDASPAVTLEEDLARRDLTINAIAQDQAGRLIDPYHGQDDLRRKVLRHVTQAFAEDPVRVLRVARFMARYHHLGFSLAPETRQLIQSMVRSGELSHLIAERVWQEWQKSLTEANPELFIQSLRACGALAVVLPEIDRLFGVPNARQHHPEIDTGIHTLKALMAAVELTADPTVRFATLLHDLGKAKTPTSVWPNHPGHEQVGVDVVRALGQRLRIPMRYVQIAETVARWHGEIHRLSKLSDTDIVDVFDKTGAFRDPDHFERLLLACEADYRGRWVNEHEKKLYANYQSGRLWRILLAECCQLTAKPWVAQGLQGQAIKQAIYQTRVACVHTLRTQCTQI